MLYSRLYNFQLTFLYNKSIVQSDKVMTAPCFLSGDFPTLIKPLRNFINILQDFFIVNNINHTVKYESTDLFKYLRIRRYLI